jgi:hypothetical protein
VRRTLIAIRRAPPTSFALFHLPFVSFVGSTDQENTMPTTVQRAALVLAFAGLTACSSSSQVPVGTNVSPIDRDDGGASGDDGSNGGSACAAIPVAAIACAIGRTVQSCDTSASPPRWVFSCPDEPAADAGASACADKPIDTIGCPNGEPIVTCDTSGATPHWDITCPATTDASDSTSSDAATACDGVPVEAIGCASGEPTYTCVTSAGAPHWKVNCP